MPPRFIAMFEFSPIIRGEPAARLANLAAGLAPAIKDRPKQTGCHAKWIWVLVCGLVILGCIAPAFAGEPTTTPHRQRLFRSLGDAVNTLTYRNARQGDKFYPININNWWGHIAQDGEVIIFPAFDWTDYKYENRMRAIRDGKTGFLRATGEFTIDPIYPYADRFAHGYAVVGDGEGKFSYINKAGSLLTSVRFDGALRFREKAAAVRVGDRIGYINPAGKALIQPRYVKARSFHDGLAAVQFPAASKRGHGVARWGYINKKASVRFVDQRGVITNAGDFNQGLARVQVRVSAKDDQAKPKRRWGYINKTFNLAVKPRFEDARAFHGGVAAVKLDGKWGYINRAGDGVIGPTFDQADDFGDNDRGLEDVNSPLALIRKGERFGYINRVGKIAIAPQFDHARPFFRGFARASQPPNFGYFDVSGRVHWDPRTPFHADLLDITRGTRARARRFGDHVGSQVLDLPPKRPQPEIPYKPESRIHDLLEVRPIGQTRD